MIKPDLYNEPTVFVLGAGASKPYGFPLGQELKTIILNIDDNQIQQLIDVKLDVKALIPDFKEALRYGDYETIDYFLERKKRFRELGSYYIATAIASSENHGILFPQNGFYKDIFSLLNLDSESDKTPEISIVTLNYDRSLEHFLTHNIKINCIDEIEEHAQNKLSKIQIIHAHGSLGDISTAPYGKVNHTNATAVQEAVQRIMIISDKLEDSSDFRKAQESIAHAKNIFFFGFGYHLRTLQKLFAETNHKGKSVFGTAMRLKEERKKEISDFFSGNIQLDNENQDSSYFIKQFF